MKSPNQLLDGSDDFGAAVVSEVSFSSRVGRDGE